MKRVLMLLVCFCLLTAGQQSQGAEASLSAGIVDSFTGDVVIENSENRVNVEKKMQFRPGDTIRTGKNSSVGLIFKDDTVVSLGPDSTFLVEEFLFKPRSGELSFIGRMLKGSFSFVTGQIGKLAPKKVKLETPNATLGVRGTKFLVTVN